MNRKLQAALGILILCITLWFAWRTTRPYLAPPNAAAQQREAMDKELSRLTGPVQTALGENASKPMSIATTRGQKLSSILDEFSRQTGVKFENQLEDAVLTGTFKYNGRIDAALTSMLAVFKANVRSGPGNTVIISRN